MTLQNTSFETIRFAIVFFFYMFSLLVVLGFILADILVRRRFRWALLISHTVSVSVTYLARIQSGDALSDMIWRIPLAFDFSLNLLLPAFALICSIFQSHLICPLLFFLILGGIQWYFLGVGIDYLWFQIFFKKGVRQVPSDLKR